MLLNNFPTKSLAKETAKLLGQAIQKNQNKEILLMFSGGSALKVLDFIDISLLSERITISVVDERFSMNPKVNNFCQLEQRKFFDACLEKGCAIVGTRIHKGETITQATINFEAQLRKWRQYHKRGFIISLLGMGEDGHTAGVLPFPESPRLFNDLFLDPEWIASYEGPDYLRFTTTLTFLKEQIDLAIVYVQGSKKKEALEKLRNSGLSIQQVPAKVFQEMKEVVVCTDIKM